MRSVKEFYSDFEEVLDQGGDFSLLEELRGKIEKGVAAKEIFLWLQEKSERGELPKEMEPLLTDFFYSIH